jgi:hypothetical protein
VQRGSSAIITLVKRSAGAKTAIDGRLDGGCKGRTYFCGCANYVVDSCDGSTTTGTTSNDRESWSEGAKSGTSRMEPPLRELHTLVDEVEPEQHIPGLPLTRAFGHAVHLPGRTLCLALIVIGVQGLEAHDFASAEAGAEGISSHTWENPLNLLLRKNLYASRVVIHGELQAFQTHPYGENSKCSERAEPDRAGFDQPDPVKQSSACKLFIPHVDCNQGSGPPPSSKEMPFSVAFSALKYPECVQSKGTCSLASSHSTHVGCCQSGSHLMRSGGSCCQ